MSCRPTYDPCLDGKLNQIGSYASVARQSAESATASATSAAASAAAAAASAEAARLYSNVPSGGGTDKIFYENDIVMTTNYTITTGRNAMSAGPITVNPGVTLTVPSGSVYTIV